MDVPNWLHKNIIGKKGANIKNMTQDLSKVLGKTGERIVFFNKNDDDKNTITIFRRKKEVEAAKNKLNSLIVHLKDIVEATTEIDTKHHLYFIAKDAEVLKQIIMEVLLLLFLTLDLKVGK
ncbi:vigilin [Nephila pilipes]|uniref:Vigilin n=1 Tax=Nephila pilipes TaxID=299642 RepID=A0A8X6NVT9_NEPPI|nr:vigilin [Nephila pilipes]